MLKRGRNGRRERVRSFLRGRDGMGHFVGEGEGALTLEQRRAIGLSLPIARGAVKRTGSSAASRSAHWLGKATNPPRFPRLASVVSIKVSSATPNYRGMLLQAATTGFNGGQISEFLKMMNSNLQFMSIDHSLCCCSCSSPPHASIACLLQPRAACVHPSPPTTNRSSLNTQVQIPLQPVILAFIVDPNKAPAPTSLGFLLLSPF